MRALIVDDSLEVREVIAAYLTAAGYPDPAKSADAEGALRLLGIDSAGITGDAAVPAEGIDVILMDIIMPGMDGIEACARIKRNAGTAETPVLMVSSRDDNTALQQAFLAGASDYVRKPIERVELLARIRSALRLKAELDRRRVQEMALRTELARLQASLTEAAIDQRAGLPSAIVALGVADLALAAGRPVSLLALAIDGFPPAGISPAHETALLRRVVAAIEALPAGLGDLVVAGSAPGSLLVLLVDRQPVEVVAFADRMRLAVERLRIAGIGGAPATVSIGLAHGHAGQTANGLLDLARRTLGGAIVRGGNRVEQGPSAAARQDGRTFDRV
ncbi:response regulator receiver domain-containing protein [Stella humosa]|uniref:Response regulator receiver domain-containing protein n=1 Tax=Stella humosa TaxID=94 RepID=A0A3N1M303_9PROT|nr:response regulator [Stella humosa]ROQ01924.1 response regulator receiver domain-containing protein [Stella humosa]BBK32313.1 hypothetical protein STHU_29470 [Stella humosa]